FVLELLSCIRPPNPSPERLREVLLAFPQRSVFKKLAEQTHLPTFRPLRALRIRSNKIREARPESPLRALGYEQRRRKTAVFSQFGPGPGGGRGGGGLDPGLLLTLGGVALVFLFPGFVLGTFNFLFIAVTVLPLLLSVGFNLFVKLNVMEAPCPNCGATLQGKVLVQKAGHVCFQV
ncbi:unnamed protein product, partial [Chrysoparadoxa australica]